MKEQELIKQTEKLELKIKVLEAKIRLLEEENTELTEIVIMARGALISKLGE